jgi:hypothetical protein
MRRQVQATVVVVTQVLYLDWTETQTDQEHIAAADMSRVEPLQPLAVDRPGAPSIPSAAGSEPADENKPVGTLGMPDMRTAFHEPLEHCHIAS